MKKRMSKKQKETLKRMKKTREIDSSNLREVLKQKMAWAQNEKKKGLQQIETTKHQVWRLEGIILFIKDLLQPEEEKK